MTPKLKIKQRDLPHWEINGPVYFITFNTWEKLELTPAAKQIVLDACKFFDNQRYQLFVLVVMPDHVHLLIQPFLWDSPLGCSEQQGWSLTSIMHSIKSYSAKQIPKVMLHIGRVWQAKRISEKYQAICICPLSPPDPEDFRSSSPQNWGARGAARAAVSTFRS